MSLSKCTIIPLLLLISFLSYITPESTQKSKFSLYAFGSSRNVLGEIDIITRPIAVNVAHIFHNDQEEILQVAAGFDHSAVLVGHPTNETYPRRIYAWGSNTKHQIRAHAHEGSTEDSTMMTLTEMHTVKDTQVVSIDLAGFVTCALLWHEGNQEYSTKCWGEILELFQVGSADASWTIKVDATLLEPQEKLVRIVISRHHVMLLGDKGTCLGTGDNYYGQLGNGEHRLEQGLSHYNDKFVKAQIPPSDHRVIDIGLAPFSTFYLTEERKLLHSGRGSNNKGVPPWSREADDNVPVPVDEVAHLNITRLSVSEAFVNAQERIMLIVFQTSTGDVYRWNYDLPFKRVDIEEPNFAYEQLSTGSTNMIALLKSSKDPNRLYVGTFGKNGFGITEPEHGLNHDKTHVWSASLFEPNEPFTFARIGGNHAVVTSKRRIWVWGDNAFSQCGRDHPPAVHSPIKIHEFDSPVKSIVASRTAALIVTESKELYSYGVNDFDLLAQPNLKVVHKPRKVRPDWFELRGNGDDTSKIVGASVSIGHSAIITDGGHAYLVGNEEYCRLGNLTATLSDPSKPVYFPIPAKVIAVENGFFHNTFLSPPEKGSKHDPEGNGVVWTNGMNAMFQLGTVLKQATRQSCEPVQVQFEKFGPDETITQIAAGEFHNVVLTSHKRVFSWGRDGLPGTHRTPVELKDLNTMLFKDEEIVKLSCGTDFTLLFTDMGRVVGFGDNANGNIDGIRNQKDPRFKAVYDRAFDMTLHMRSMSVLQPDEHVVDAAAAHYSTLVYTNHSRLVHFGSFFYDEDDELGVDFVNGTTFHALKFECPRLNLLGAGNSAGFIVCEEDIIEPSLWEKYRTTVFIVSGIFGGVSLVVVAIVAVLGCGVFKTKTVALLGALRGGTRQTNKYGQLPDNDQDALWEEGNQVNVFDEDLVEEAREEFI